MHHRSGAMRQSMVSSRLPLERLALIKDVTLILQMVPVVMSSSSPTDDSCCAKHGQAIPHEFLSQAGRTLFFAQSWRTCLLAPKLVPHFV